MRNAVFLPSLLLLTALVRGGTLVTTDGETLNGDIKRVEGGWAVTDEHGEPHTIALAKVKSIALSSGPTDADRAAAALASLRRSVEFGDDLGKIVQRYQAFVAQTKDPATLALAREDLGVWQDRLSRGLVKLGRRWVTVEERDRVARQLRGQAEQGRLLIKDGRDEDAGRLINGTLDTDPGYVSALYLRGVLENKRGDFVAARKSFAAVQQALPQHPPTLLNLSILLLRQKQWGPACAALDQALAAAPVSRELLDNAAEFLNLLPAEPRKSAAAQKLAKRFFEQDARLQKVMAARQLYRWGGSWIGQAEYDKVVRAQNDTKDKLKGLETDFAQTEQGITGLDRQIADDERAMRDIEAHSFITAPDGTALRVPYPRTYYDLQGQITQARTDRAAAAQKLDALRAQARDVQKGVPAPTYTGVLTPVAEDGVPLVGPAEAPATEPVPATTPAAPPTPDSDIRVGPP